MTRVEHWGTSVVENFGDLLYPLVLARELPRLDPALEVCFADPFGGPAPMGLHHSARRAIRHGEPGFWSQVADVDAIVIGGGDLIHHGTTSVQHRGAPARIENWLFAEAGLLGEVRPVAWNGLGVPFDVPPELAPGLRAACGSVALLTVRDEGSRRRLEAAGVDRDIQIVPDTGVLIDDVVPEEDRRAALDALVARGEHPPDGDVLVAHVSFASPVVLAEVAGALRACVDADPDLQLVLLPTGPAHGDEVALAALAAQLDRPAWRVTRPTVTDIASVLSRATTVVSSSFHASLVAAVFGVPFVAFSHYGHRPAKLVDLVQDLGREHWLLDRPSSIPDAVAAARTESTGEVTAAVARLKVGARAHLAQVADVVGRPSPSDVDLPERDAAHGHALGRVAATEAALVRARQDLAILGGDLERALERSRTLEVGYWRVRDRHEAADPTAAASGPTPPTRVLDLEVIDKAELRAQPYRWGHVGPLYGPDDLERLGRTVPLASAEQRADSDGRRSWSYRVRCLVPMGGRSAVRPHELDPAWRGLAEDLAGDAYRESLSRLTGVDLHELDLEANVFSYPLGGYQEPHQDLPEKVVTHVLWFNEGWDAANGGCLRILNSRDEQDVYEELLPELGWSAVFVRSDTSWHSVTAVTDTAPVDRRAVVATFYRPGSPSTMWPNGA